MSSITRTADLCVLVAHGRTGMVRLGAHRAATRHGCMSDLVSEAGSPGVPIGAGATRHH